ncbi:MAG: hypothetical protein U0V54_01670 [Saprospiraceae bacterium]|nr:hypothetical protein [Saprospiraceae bacterium]
MDKKSKYRTNVLFQRTSFLKGMGSVLNISGNYYQFDYSDSSLIADSKAIKSDWGVIGQDIKNAAEQLIETNTK